MDDKTLMMILVAIATIAFFVFVYFASKTWTIAHVAMTVLVYFGAFAFLLLAAATLRTHENWRARYNELIKSTGDQKLAVELLANGTALDEEGTVVTLATAEETALQNKRSIAELGRLIAEAERDRGRVWRGCTPNIGMNSIVLTLPTVAAEGVPVDPMADPMAAPPAAGTVVPHGIRKDALLYVFREGEIPTADMTTTLRVPAAYMGEFVVLSTTESSVTIAPTPASVELAARWREGGGNTTWVAYETVPGDRHEVFAGMDEARIRALIPKPAGVPDDIYERRIREYTHHGEKADPTDPPDQVWVKVKFSRKIDIEVDAKDAQAVVDSYFNATGQALPVLLHQGQRLSVEPGAELLLERSVAKRLIDEGACTELEQVFVRRLHDYEYMFRDFLVRRTDILRRKAIVEADTVIQRGSAAQLQVNIDARTIEIGKLKADQEKFLRDKSVITAYAGELGKKRASLLAELSQLYNQNNQLAAQIAQLQVELARQIEARLKAAAESAAPPAPPAPSPSPPAAPMTPPAATPAPPAAPMAPPAASPAGAMP